MRTQHSLSNGTARRGPWSPAPRSPERPSCTSVSCASATLCMAVGGSEDSTLTEQWNGSTWTVVPSPNLTGFSGNDFNGVSCPSTTFCMAAGQANGPSYAPLAASWNGTTWTLQTDTDHGPGHRPLLQCGLVHDVDDVHGRRQCGRGEREPGRAVERHGLGHRVDPEPRRPEHRRPHRRLVHRLRLVHGGRAGLRHGDRVPVADRAMERHPPGRSSRAPTSRR